MPPLAVMPTRLTAAFFHKPRSDIDSRAGGHQLKMLLPLAITTSPRVAGTGGLPTATPFCRPSLQLHMRKTGDPRWRCQVIVRLHIRPGKRARPSAAHPA